jgi:hypothetical protein
MTKGDEDDPGNVPESELLSLPANAIPAEFWRMWARRGEVIQQQNRDELALERAGDSSRHLMITAEDDPREKQKREERNRREQFALFERQERLLAAIEEQQIELEKRRREIEDNALRLRDGRRAYVDGNVYRDEQGRVLSGADEADAARAHAYQPNASSWQEKQQADEQAGQLRRLKENIIRDRDQGLDPGQAAARLAGYEKEFNDQVQKSAAQAAPAYGGADYMADLGDEYTISTVPAFTQAARSEAKEQPARKDTDVTEAKSALRPASGPGGLKPG